MSSFVLFVASALLSSPAFGAALRPADVLGAKQVELAEFGSISLCSVPAGLPGRYSEQDRKLEEELCGWEAGRNVAVCPKLSSTNPALHFIRVTEAGGGNEAERKRCADGKAKRVAKYKLSFSCSYAPSILAYYHVSRMLGGVLNVPPAVLRSFPRAAYLERSEWAEAQLQAQGDQPIRRWWARLRTVLQPGGGKAVAGLLFTEDGKQTYGALQASPKGEKYYREFNDRGPDRPRAFREGNPIYAELTRRELRVPREFSAANAQRLRQLKDAADMLLLDTLLNQQDRFGNIHYITKYYSLVQGPSGARLRVARKREELPAAGRAGPVAVKEILLKDNDCGVAKDPAIKDAGLLDEVAHIDPESYRSFLRFWRFLGTPEAQNFFERGLWLTRADLASIRRNADEVGRNLLARCRAGALRLDLNPEDHFTGKGSAAGCELD